MARHILFDGTTTGNFTHLDGTPCSWPINGDGSMTVGHGNIKSVFTYGDGGELFHDVTIENIQIPKTIASFWGETIIGSNNDKHPALTD